jgi:BON domain
MRIFVFGTAIGTLLAYFFDPQNGRRRRALFVDRSVAGARSGGRQAARTGAGVASRAYGVKQQVKHRHEEPKDLDDATLADKVRTEIFRDADAPKGDVVVNVQDGVVQLRGEVEPELTDALVAQAGAVEGVRDVENLLHAPGTRAPMHE